MMGVLELEEGYGLIRIIGSVIIVAKAVLIGITKCIKILSDSLCLI